MKKIFLSISFIFLLQSEVMAENVLASCGSSQGKTYYIDGNNNGNWHDDRITNGSIKLIFDNNNAADIIISDKGGTFSARSDGAKVLTTHIDEAKNIITVLVVYPKPVIETYQFHLSAQQKYVVWTAAKAISNYSSIKAMRAECE